MEPQHGPGRHQATARIKWSKEVNKIVMRCFYKSEPNKRGYRKRMLEIWTDIGVFEVTEQRLADQSRAIRTNGWLTGVELEEIQREIQGVHETNGICREDTNGRHELSGSGWSEDVFVEEENDNRINGENVEELRAMGVSEEKINLILEIRVQMEKDESPPNLRYVERSRLKQKVDQVNEVLGFIVIPDDITAINKLLAAAGSVVGRHLGAREKRGQKAAEPWWKRRINQQITQLRKDVIRLEKWNGNELGSERIKCKLKNKYKIEAKGLSMVIEELKQRIIAKAAKVKRYENRADQYAQNRLFQSNQKRLFELLEGNERDDDVRPNEDEFLRFWSEIWDNPVRHNKRAEWLNEVKKELNKVKNQEDIVLTTDKVKKQLKK